ncbi:Protein of unknown function [Bacillus toyonensis]|nr:Protein of unknown function [Bacillus toyonensis]
MEDTLNKVQPIWN